MALVSAEDDEVSLEGGVSDDDDFLWRPAFD